MQMSRREQLESEGYCVCLVSADHTKECQKMSYHISSDKNDLFNVFLVTHSLFLTESRRHLVR
jgi:hypothetical protein